MESQLLFSWKNLKVSWEQTKKDWNDSVKQAFENKYWIVLERHTLRTLDSLQTLSEAIAEADS